MGLDLYFERKSGSRLPVPRIPRWCGHREFLQATSDLPAESFKIPDRDGDNAWRFLDCTEAACIVSKVPECQRGHLRILWQMRRYPDLFLAVSY